MFKYFLLEDELVSFYFTFSSKIFLNEDVLFFFPYLSFSNISLLKQKQAILMLCISSHIHLKQLSNYY